MDKIRVGIIGAGGVGYEHIQGYQTSGHADVIAVTTRTEEHGKLAAEKFGIEAWYTDYRELLKRKDIDAVSICTPNYLHAQQTVDAARAGKHILCEKPLATTLEDADKMIKAAHDAKVYLMNPSHQRFIPILKEIKGILDQFGSITFVRYRFAHQGPYKAWKALSKEKWFFDETKAGGGVLLDLAPHALDILEWYFGDVEVVQGALLKTFEHPIKTEDTAILLFKFKNGTLAELDTSWASEPEFNEFQIYGTKGTIKVDLWERAPIEIMPKKLRKNEKISQLSLTGILTQVAVAKRNMMHYFVDCVRNNKEPEMNGQLGKGILKVILAGYKSAGSKSIFML
jgi:predicted dehydrogenase